VPAVPAVPAVPLPAVGVSAVPLPAVGVSVAVPLSGVRAVLMLPGVVMVVVIVVVVVVRRFGVVVWMLAATPLDPLTHERRQLESVRLVPLSRQHDDPAEQAAVHAFADVPRMVVERPSADHVVADVEAIRPALAGTDLVGSTTVSRLRPQRP
jgi:hypothetical protein